MKEIFDFLDDKDKKRLGFLSIFLTVGVLFLLFISLPQRSGYIRTLSSFTGIQRDYQQVDKTKMEKEGEWLMWQETRRDMEELKTEYFYDDKEGIRQLRLDLEQLLDKSGFYVPRKKYDYIEFNTEKVKKVIVSFNLKGSYLALKRFINTVEGFPKFLVIEKIDFLNIDVARGDLELKITLAGYYES